MHPSKEYKAEYTAIRKGHKLMMLAYRSYKYEQYTNNKTEPQESV